jgi:hypothetical protein
MAIDILKDVAVPVVTALTGGLGVLFFQRYCENNIFGGKDNYTRLSGHWYGMHVANHAKSGVLALSLHEYDLAVTRDGRISGTMRDGLINAETKWLVRGNAFPGGMALIDQHSERPSLFAAELYTNSLDDPTRLRGVISSFNYHDGGHFAAIIVLSRSPISEEQFEAHVADVRPPTFHTNLPTQAKDLTAQPPVVGISQANLAAPQEQEVRPTRND